VKIIDDDNDDTYDDKGRASSAALNASVSTRCGASSGCEGGDGHQILRVAGNILNKQLRTSDKGCPPEWWMRVLLTSQQFDSLMRYGILNKASD
jgi:hypothetical protein